MVPRKNRPILAPERSASCNGSLDFALSMQQRAKESRRRTTHVFRARVPVNVPCTATIPVRRVSRRALTTVGTRHAPPQCITMAKHRTHKYVTFGHRTSARFALNKPRRSVNRKKKRYNDSKYRKLSHGPAKNRAVGSQGSQPTELPTDAADAAAVSTGSTHFFIMGFGLLKFRLSYIQNCKLTVVKR